MIDIKTLAAAKAYTDRQRLAYDERVSLGDTLTWDGTPTDTSVPIDGSKAALYLVSDKAPSVDELVGGSFTVSAFNKGELIQAVDIDITRSNAIQPSDNVIMLFKDGNPFIGIALEDGISFNMGFGLITIPKKGIYFLYTNYQNIPDVTYVSSLTIPNYNFTKSVTHKIDPKYLPEGSAGYAEIGAVIYDVALEDFGGGIMGCEITVETGLVVGKRYIVQLDSGTYKSECKAINGINYIGNVAMGGSGVDTGESYIIMTEVSDDGITLSVVDVSNGTHCTITEEIVHQIDAKYLPCLNVPVVDIASPTKLTDEEKAKLTACIGSPIWLRSSNVIMLMSYAVSIGDDGSPIYRFDGAIGTSGSSFHGNGAGDWVYMPYNT